MYGLKCPKCKRGLVGLYYNRRLKDKKRTLKPIRKAFLCKYCDLVLKDNEVVFKTVIYLNMKNEKIE